MPLLEAAAPGQSEVGRLSGQNAVALAPAEGEAVLDVVAAPPGGEAPAAVATEKPHGVGRSVAGQGNAGEGSAGAPLVGEADIERSVPAEQRPCGGECSGE